MDGSGFSRMRLGRMRSVMAGYVERGEVPGVVTLVSRRGETHVEAVGTMAAGGGAPLARDTIFRIASMTKPVAAAGAMILIEECKLRLGDPIEQWLPELGNRRVLKRPEGALDDTVPAKRPVTVRDLLTLRMGIGLILPPGSYPIQQALRTRGLGLGPRIVAMAPDAWLAALGELPLVHQPGEVWMYDTALDVLGVLIARASGQSLETFLRERLFEPLGMKDTGFSVPAEKLHRLPVCYHSDPESGKTTVWDAAEGGLWSRPPVFASARAGLVSTVDDFLAFGAMLLNQGRHGSERILSRAAVAVMTADQLTAEQRAGGEMILGSNRSWGLGLSVITKRGEIAAVPGRFGWDGGYGTSWTSDPAEGVVGILMTQRLWDSPKGPAICRDFWTSVYQALGD